MIKNSRTTKIRKSKREKPKANGVYQLFKIKLGGGRY